MENKRINAKTVKNFLSNNAIIILIVILALVVGIITDNFFISYRQNLEYKIPNSENFVSSIVLPSTT